MTFSFGGQYLEEQHDSGRCTRFTSQVNNQFKEDSRSSSTKQTSISKPVKSELSNFYNINHQSKIKLHKKSVTYRVDK